MATETNRINTRILLKYDTYANWTSNNPKLLKGEVAVATVDNTETNTQSTGFQNLPNVVIKVGDGSNNYNALPFLSALAADVYGWAKEAKKPTYSASEIGLLPETIGEVETNTTYRIVADGNYKYHLESKEKGNSNWTAVEGSVIDLSAVIPDFATRIPAIEKDIADLKAAVNTINGNDTGKSMRTVAAEEALKAVQGLDAQVSIEDNGNTNPLNITIKEVDGVITEVTGSIDDVFDAKGAAAAVLGVDGDAATANTVYGAKKAAAEALKAAQDAAKAAQDEAEAREKAIQDLDYSGYVAGEETGETISFVGTISETDGIIEATKRDLVFNTAYNPTSNKAATMADVTGAVANLAGAMHFVGKSSTKPDTNGVTINDKEYTGKPGDVVIYELEGTPVEYVYDGTNWQQLGREGIAAKLIADLDMAEVTVPAGHVISKISETDGIVKVETAAITISQDQVTDLGGDLTALEKKIDDEIKRSTEEDGEHTEAIKTINGDDTGMSMRQVAIDVVADLDVADAAVDGQYVSAVSQIDGVIKVTRAALPTIPEIKVEEGDATKPSDETVTVVTGIAASGHTITDTKVTEVITKTGLDKAIQDLDSTVSVSDNKKVLTGITQADGVLTDKTEVTLADIAFSGKVDDLKQDDNTYIVFDCGSSSKNI